MLLMKLIVVVILLSGVVEVVNRLVEQRPARLIVPEHPGLMPGQSVLAVIGQLFYVIIVTAPPTLLKAKVIPVVIFLNSVLLQIVIPTKSVALVP